jgi:hypothetical protein
MLANIVTFAIGFGLFLVAFVVLAVYVVRFAGRLGRRTETRDFPPRPDASRPADKERNKEG